MIETIENLKNLVNHFFHKTGEGFEEIRKCPGCGSEYLATDLVGVGATAWEVVLGIKCHSCEKEDAIQLNISIDLAGEDTEKAIAKATTVEELLSGQWN